MNFKKNYFVKALTLLLLLLTIKSNSQSFNEDKTAFGNFLKRMYNNTPFEGVKIVDDYNQQYLVSVISLDKAKYNNESTMNRVAQVKAQSQANTFVNGASISMDMVITTTEVKDSLNRTETISQSVESIKQNSMGFTQGLELLTNFENADAKRMVFIFYRAIKQQ
jgi:hypothetical protein